jgi:hypothetical protein
MPRFFRQYLFIPAGALAIAPLVASCGGAGAPTNPPTPIPTPIPTPTPEPTPTPDPDVPPPGSGCHKPYPPPISRFNIKIHMKQRDYWMIDSTPLVTNANYCRRIGYSDRSTCPLRVPGADDREACEQWRAGNAKDTGKPGPTWTVTLRDGTTSYCTGPTGPCEHFPDLPFDVKAYKGGVYRVCIESGEVCGKLTVDRGL